MGTYRIKTLERLTGLSRNTVTAWERRYGLLAPAKDPSGYRVYSEEDVALLRAIRAELDAGFSIGEAIARVRGAVREAPPSPSPSPSPGGLPDGRAAVLDALLAFDRAAADEAHAPLAELPLRTRLEEVYLRLLREVGDRWADGAVSVAQEHFVSAFCREHLLQVLRALDFGPAEGPVAVCAGFPGERHELGLVSVAIHLALRGSRVVYLGADLPADELVGAVRELHAERPVELVAQSILQPCPESRVLDHARAVRAGLPAEVLLVLGGPGVAPLAGHPVDGVSFCPTLADLLDGWQALRRGRVRHAG